MFDKLLFMYNIQKIFVEKIINTSEIPSNIYEIVQSQFHKGNMCENVHHKFPYYGRKTSFVY